MPPTTGSRAVQRTAVLRRDEVAGAVLGARKQIDPQRQLHQVGGLGNPHAPDLSEIASRANAEVLIDSKEVYQHQDVKIRDVLLVTDLEDGTFYADLVMVRDGEEVTVSSRPSDAIALAARTKSPLFAAAEVIVEGEYRTGAQEHVYLETQGMLAWEEDGVITVTGSMQCPYYIVDAFEHALGRAPDQVRIIQAATRQGVGSTCSNLLRKVRECVHYAARHGAAGSWSVLLAIPGLSPVDARRRDHLLLSARLYRPAAPVQLCLMGPGADEIDGWRRDGRPIRVQDRCGSGRGGRRPGRPGRPP